MNLLILGGTVFLGRALVDAAMERGHTLTLFNRGASNPDLYPDIEQLRGDRDGGLDALAGRQWDAVIDTNGYVPRIVRQAAQLLADSVQHYTFISTISVYRDFFRAGIDEHYPVAETDQPESEDRQTLYGPLKALCEAVVDQHFAGRTLTVRPGLIVGPHDPTDRFTYWPVRLSRGGTVLAPDRPDRLVQVIDVRDLAEWTVQLVERRITGIFNATGPDHPLTMGDVLTTANGVGGQHAEFQWLPEQFLLEHEVRPWMELPLWVPDTPEYAGFATVDCRKAITTGLIFRPLEATVRDTLAWASTRPPEYQWRAGLDAEKECDLLARRQRL